MELPVNRFLADVSWYSVDKKDGAVTVTVREADRLPPATVRFADWVDAARFARDVLAVALDGEPIVDQP
jgi:hypothetical protein